MASVKRGVQSIRTMGVLVDKRRARTPAGALLELSAMANEKQLLQRELARWGRRHAEIQVRLGEIAAKEQRLMAVVQNPSLTSSVTPLPPTEAAAARRLRIKEFTY
jgi:hypothetical protein